MPTLVLLAVVGSFGAIGAAVVWRTWPRATPTLTPPTVPMWLAGIVVVLVGLQIADRVVRPPTALPMESTHLAALLGQGSVQSLFVWGVLLAGWISGRASRSDWGRHERAAVAANRPLAAGLTLLLAAVVLTLSALLERFGVVGDHQLIDALRTRGTPLLWAAVIGSAVLVAPLAEELIYRVLLQSTLRKRLPAAAAVAASSLAFMAVHEPAVMLTVLPLAVVNGMLFERTGSYGLVVVVHALFNAAMLGLLGLQMLLPAGPAHV